MSNLYDLFFGPLNQFSCNYFLIVTSFFFVGLVGVLLTEVMYAVRNFRSLTFRHVTGAVLVAFNIFLAYFVNRLMYTMCNKALA